MPEKDYKRLSARAGEQGAGPDLPKPDARGEYPAVEYARVSLARKIIKARRLAGLSQAALARRASIRPACHGEAQQSRETLNRIERGRTTLAKIDRALETAKEEGM